MPDHNVPYEPAATLLPAPSHRHAQVLSEMAAVRRTPRGARLLREVKPHASGWWVGPVLQAIFAVPGRLLSPRPGRLIRSAVTWVGFAIIMAFMVALVSVIAWYLAKALTKGQTLALPAAPSSEVVGMIAMMGFHATLLIGARWEARRTGHGDRRLGLADRPIERRGLLVVLTAVLLAYLGLLTAAIVAFYLAKGGAVVPRVAPGVLMAQAGMAATVLQGLLLVAVAPLAEELFFRGWLWTGFRAHRSARWTAVVTSFLWLLLHLPDGWAKPLYLIPTAVLLSLARHYCNSVRASILMHIVNNLVAFGLITIGGRAT